MPALRRGVDRSRMSWPPRRLAAFIRTVASSIAVLGLLLTVHASATSVAAGRAVPASARPPRRPVRPQRARYRPAYEQPSRRAARRASSAPPSGWVHGFAPSGSARLSPARPQRLVEVGPEVLDVLDADREAQQVRRRADARRRRRSGARRSISDSTPPRLVACVISCDALRTPRRRRRRRRRPRSEIIAPKPA